MLRVSPWHWQKMLLSDHAPNSQAARLVALVIADHMKTSQPFSWVSQVTIAKRAQLSDRHVRRLVGQLVQAEWLESQLWKRDMFLSHYPQYRSVLKHTGRGREMTLYFPAVPDELLEVVKSLPTKKGSSDQDIAMSGTQHGVSPDCRTFGAGLPDIWSRTAGHLEPDSRTSGCPRKSLSLSLNSEVVREGPPDAKPRLRLPRAIEKDTAEERAARIDTAIAMMKGQDDETIKRCVQGATLTEVRERRARLNGATR